MAARAVDDSAGRSRALPSDADVGRHRSIDDPVHPADGSADKPAEPADGPDDHPRTSEMTDDNDLTPAEYIHRHNEWLRKSEVTEGPGSNPSTDDPSENGPASETADEFAIAEQICDRVGIDDPDEIQAVADVYESVREYTAPFIVKVTDDILAALRTDAEQNPDLTVAFLGRDGHSLALAARRLDPEFYERHAHEVVLSRSVADAAVQDLETNTGQSFPEIDDFRGARNKVDPAATDGAFLRLTEYLQRSGIPAGENSHVALVDTSYKGTVQELLSAIYPQTEFLGRYVFYGASPYDPHPGSKRGFALHLDSSQSHGGLPLDELPDEFGLTLAHQDAIGSIEETLHGPLSSPTRIDSNNLPAQTALRYEPDTLSGINPIKVSSQYSSPVVREAAKDAALLAVAYYAEAVATQRSHGGDPDTMLRSGFDKFNREIRSWILGHSDSESKFGRVLDSFVRRTDKAEVIALNTAVQSGQLEPEAAAHLWQQFDALGTSRADKQSFVSQVRRDLDVDKESQ